MNSNVFRITARSSLKNTVLGEQFSIKGTVNVFSSDPDLKRGMSANL